MHGILKTSQIDAYAACSLYQAKNSTNSKFVFRCIEQRVAELLSSAMPSRPLEILARIQALIIYQIIRIFDGDVRVFHKACLRQYADLY
jgi:hypothetical protein